MLLRRFESVRGRLLAVAVLILVPIAVLNVIFATVTYRSVSGSIEASQVEVTSHYAVRVRVWFRGILRTLIATTAALEEERGNNASCSRTADQVRLQTGGIQAVFVRFANGVTCTASGFAYLSQEILSSIASAQARKGNVALWGGAELGDARYDVVTVGDHKHLVVFVRTTAGSTPGSEAVMLLDPQLLDVTFDIGSFGTGGIVALVARGQSVVVARGAADSDRAWLPAAEDISTSIRLSRQASLRGQVHVYASQIVAEPDLYVLARFDNATANAAFMQFLALCVTPLLMLGVLFVGYVWGIERNVLRWLHAIDRATHARREGRRAQVIVDDAMPSDVKRLAASFNEMLRDADSREHALRMSFEGNQHLARELHHRVKNSLQVIQSYLALSRRLHKRNNDRHIIETEAKVQVLSVAYRLALLDGSMRPVPLGVFAQEILDNLATSLRRKNQWIDIAISTDAGLSVDRTIPVGLALVEAVAAGLSIDNAQTVHVTVRTEVDGQVAIAVIVGEHVGDDAMPPPKIMAGLASQIGAIAQPIGDGHILNWRFMP